MADKDFAVKNGLTVNGSVLVVNTATGRIGINTTSPDATIQIVGTANVSGAVRITGVLTAVSTISGSIDGNANNSSNLGGTAAALFALRTEVTANAATAYTNAVSYAASIAATAFANAASRADSAYSNAVAIAANATNITSGTISNLRLPAAISVTSLAGSGAGITSVNAATVGSNTALTLRAYSDTTAATAYSNAVTIAATAFANAASRADSAYSNAVAIAANATNITSGTISNLRLPAAISVTSLAGSGAGITSVNAATVGGNSAVTLRAYSDTMAATAHTNAVSYAASISATAFSNAASRADSAYSNAVTIATNASNISSGTLANARLPAAISVTSLAGSGSGITGVNASTLGGYGSGSFALLSGATFSGAVTFQSRITQSASGFVIGDKADISARTDSGFFQSATTTTAAGWPVNDGGWYHLISTTHSNDANYYAMQFACSFYDSNLVFFRATNGSGAAGWNRLLHSGNYNSWAPTLTGTGASGTWGISITGSANYATSAGSATSATSATSASSATLATKASTLSQGGGNGTAMTFNWAGQGGQPSWLWGSNDGSTHYIYNPSNFSVAYAATAPWAGISSKPDVLVQGESNRTLFSFRTNIMYDNDDPTNYYLDMNGTSRINVVHVHSMLDAGDNTYYIDMNGTSRMNALYVAQLYDIDDGTYYINMNATSRMNAIHVNVLYDINNAGYYLDINGTNRMAMVDADNINSYGYITASGDISSLSDRRTKHDIKKIDNALDKLLTLTGVTYRRNSDDVEATGLIAQDVNEVLPQAIQVNEDGYMSLAYGNMLGLVVEAIKELKREIDELKRA